MLHSYGKSADAKIPSRYAINMAWINRTLNEAQPYLSADKTEEELIANFLDKAKQWQVANPEAEVNIWYDSQFATKEAVQATRKVLDTKVQKDILSKIKLRDIRELEIIKNNPDIFSDLMPIYFRVDIIKLIVCLHSIEHDSHQASIFSDLDVGDFRSNKSRMEKKELFKPEIMARLLEIGIQLGIDDMGKVENQFIQILNKPETLTALKIIIDANMLRGVTALNLSKEHKGHLRELSSAAFTPLVKETIPLILGLSTNHKNHKMIKINAKLFDEKSSEEWIDYNPLIHGCLPLGNFYRSAYGGAMMLTLETKKVEYPSTYIQLPEVPSEIKLGRDDMNSRMGSDHMIVLNDLIDRPPANGEKYQCRFIISPNDGPISKLKR